MEVKQFQENLLIYGANVYQWPKEIRKEGLKALESFSELRVLVEEHEQFEKVLKTRRYEETSSNLAQRIISANSQQKQKASFSLGSFISELLNEFHLPKPALAAISIMIISVLVIGFAIGFFNTTESILTAKEETNLQAFLYYEGDVL